MTIASTSITHAVKGNTRAYILASLEGEPGEKKKKKFLVEVTSSQAENYYNHITMLQAELQKKLEEGFSNFHKVKEWAAHRKWQLIG